MGPPPAPHAGGIPPDQQKMIKTHDSQLVAASHYKEEWHKTDYDPANQGLLHPQDVAVMFREIRDLKEQQAEKDREIHQLKYQVASYSSTDHEERRWHPDDPSKPYTWKEFKVEAEKQLGEEDWWYDRWVGGEDSPHTSVCACGLACAVRAAVPR